MSEIEKKSKFISNISSNLSNEDNENDENYYNDENSDTEINKEVKISDEIHNNLLDYVATTKNHTIIPLCEYLTSDIVLEFVETLRINNKSLLYYLKDE